MGFTVKSVPTTPYEGQKTGTSGLRKKTKVVMDGNYLANWCVSLLGAFGTWQAPGSHTVVRLPH